MTNPITDLSEQLEDLKQDTKESLNNHQQTLAEFVRNFASPNDIPGLLKPCSTKTRFLIESLSRKANLYKMKVENTGQMYLLHLDSTIAELQTISSISQEDFDTLAKNARNKFDLNQYRDRIHSYIQDLEFHAKKLRELERSNVPKQDLDKIKELIHQKKKEFRPELNSNEKTAKRVSHQLSSKIVKVRSAVSILDGMLQGPIDSISQKSLDELADNDLSAMGNSTNSNEHVIDGLKREVEALEAKISVIVDSIDRKSVHFRYVAAALELQLIIPRFVHDLESSHKELLDLQSHLKAVGLVSKSSNRLTATNKGWSELDVSDLAKGIERLPSKSSYRHDDPSDDEISDWDASLPSSPPGEQQLTNLKKQPIATPKTNDRIELIKQLSDLLKDPNFQHDDLKPEKPLKPGESAERMCLHFARHSLSAAMSKPNQSDQHLQAASQYLNRPSLSRLKLKVEVVINRNRNQ